MAFKIIYGDIAVMKVDAIVNSLGVDSQVLGAICKNIAFKAKSKQIDELLQSHKDGKVFDMYVTDAGLLPADKVIHIVTPFKKYDDEKFSSLKKAYEMVIEKAIELGCKEVAIPFLGTGANGYARKNVFDVVTEIGVKYMESKDISILVTMYNNNLEKFIHMRNKEEENLNNRISKLKPKEIEEKYATDYYPPQALASIEMNKIFNLTKKSEMFAPMGKVRNAMDFIYDYIENKKMVKDEYNIWCVNRGQVHRFRSGIKPIEKIDLYKSVIYLSFNRTMFLQAMSYAEFSFSPNSKLDQWMYNYYMENDICKTFVEFQERYFDNEIFKMLFSINSKNKSKK